MKLIFATQNNHKVREIQQIMPDGIEIASLLDIGCTEDIPETAHTLEGNATMKSEYVLNKFNVNCFADDTGLEIEALNGEPGIFSARYAGSDKNPEKNIDLVLEKLRNVTNRKARFRTVISLQLNGKEYLFEGMVNGTIRHERSGTKGFGYDPIFQPEGYDITFSEMSLEEKNKISHRGRAVHKLTTFLGQIAD